MTVSSSFTAFSVPAALESIRPATKVLLATAKTWGVGAASGGLFEVAVAEVMINAVKHGSREGGEFRCELELSNGSFLVRVFDSGLGFDPADPDLPSPRRDRPEHLAETGYGLAIVYAVFTDVRPVWRDGLFGVELTLALDAPLASMI